MCYLLFIGESYDPELASQMFVSSFATVEEAQQHPRVIEYGGGEIASFDGSTLRLVCEKPHWKRYDPPQIPVGRMIDEWGLSDK